jgi:hypothetical protein
MNLQGFIPLEYKSFTLGFTDYVYSNETGRCVRNDNLLVTPNEKYESRPGSTLLYPAHPQHPNGSNRIGRFIKSADETKFLAQSGPILAYDSGTEFVAITGPTPTSNNAFPLLPYTANVSWSEWRGHFFFTADTSNGVSKAYVDGSGNWQIRTAGMPHLDATQYSSSEATVRNNLTNLANEIRTRMLLHFADVTDHVASGFTTHKTADTAAAAVIGAAVGGSQLLTDIIRLTSNLLDAYQIHFLDYKNSSAHHYREITEAEWLASPSPVFGIETVPPMATLADQQLEKITYPTTLVECVERLQDLKTRFTTHDGNVDIHGGPGNAGLYAVGATDTLAFSQGPLIYLDPTPIYDLANALKSRYNAHIAAGASGSYAHTTADATNVVTAAAATTPLTLAALINDLVIQMTAHNQDANKAAAWSFHRAQRSPYQGLNNSIFFGASLPLPDVYGGLRGTNWSGYVERLNELLAFHNTHAGDTVTHHAAATTGANSYVVPGVTLNLADYVYGFCYKYTYTAGDVEIIDRGPVLLVDAFGVIPTEYSALAIANLPVLANGTYGNWDTANVVIEIWRTTDDGSVLFYVGEVTNGTTTFTDRVPDSELEARERLYTTGGVVDNDPPPAARCLHIVNNIAYYGYITEYDADNVAVDRYPGRLRQSIPDDPDSCPEDFYDDLESAVIGISSVKTIPIALCERHVYRIEGQFTELGQGAMTHQAISETIGCVSEASIVKTTSGVFFAGTDGFYFTDAYQVTKLSHNWDETYAGMISTSAKAKRIQGTFDPITNRIWWTCQMTSTSTDNDAFVILDLNFPLGANPCWTTASNTGHLAPTAALFYNKKMRRGHALGYIFEHQDDLTEDPYVDTSTTPANWGTKAIAFDYTSCFTDFGQSNIRKWIPWIEYNLQNDTNINIQINSLNDKNRAPEALALQRSHTHWIWGEEELVWGDATLMWDFVGNLDEKRHFPKTTLRATYKQVQFTNAWVTFQTSHDKGTATTAGVANTVTLDTALTYWPLNPEGYFISFSNDNYETEFEIKKKNSTTLPTVLTVLDPDNVLPSGSYDWRIVGYEKGQRFHLLDYTLYGKPLSRSQQGSRSASNP